MERHLILFDFDETYFKHNTTSEDINDLKNMEETLRRLSEAKNVMIAILTGSSIESVMAKMRSINMTFQPHHIFSDLSTKMFTLQNGEYVESDQYKKIVLQTPFLKEEVYEIIKEVSYNNHCELKPQRNFKDDETLYNFYYFSQGNKNTDLKILNELKEYAASKNYTVKYNECNPLAGDPINAYDVDFIPNNSGKLFAAKYLIDLYDISRENVVGFGDSGNDYEFLSYVQNSFVMRNSKDQMMRSKFNLTKYPYYKGINYHINQYDWTLASNPKI